MSEQRGQLSREVQGNIRDHPIFEISHSGKPDGMCGTNMVYIIFEREGGFFFASLCLDWYDFRTVLDDKVNLTVFRGIIPRFYRK